MASYKIAVAVIIGLVISIGVGFGIGIQPSTHQASGHPEIGELQSQLASPAVPGDAIQLSEIVPTMGEHWGNPEDLPLGPIYLVHDGEVIGIEYMFTQEMMEEVTIPGEGSFLHISGLPVNTYVDHVNIEFLSQGHEGFEVPHYDVHLYFISVEEQHAIVPHTHAEEGD